MLSKNEGGSIVNKELEQEEIVVEKKSIGEVKIASEVGKNMSKGVKVILSGDTVHVDMTINMMYGYSIPKVSKQVQEKVSQQIENMTGLVVPEVNVRIAGVNLED